MKYSSLIVSACLFALSVAITAHAAEGEKDLRNASAEDIAKWRQLKFGMFIHWGPISQKGTEIGWSRGKDVPAEEYDNLYKTFNPTKFNAEQWMKVAHDAGVKYVVFTTRHHDGFCMWDTKQTDYNIMHTPFARDVVKELSKACAKEGLLFGTYHSVCDWWHPDFPLGSPGGTTKKPSPNLDRYEQYLTKMLGELTTNYGTLVTVWFDVPQEFDTIRGQRLIDLVRTNQPHIVVNNRSGAPGDYDTPEQCVGKMQTSRPWESCMTICQQWSYKSNDEMKSLKECIQTLVRVVSGDGNLLFNVAPTPEGTIEPRQIERLHEIGQWLDKYGRTIFNTRGGPFPRGSWGGATYNGNTIYLHILNNDLDKIHLHPISRKIVSCEVLTGGTATFKQSPQAVEVFVPKESRNEIDTIVALKLDGPAADALPPDVPSLAIGKKATASNVWRNEVAEFGPDKAFDNNPMTRWSSDPDARQCWLEVDLGEPKTIGRVMIQEDCGSRIQEFELLAKTDNGWEKMVTGTRTDDELEFPPVKVQIVRLNILKSTEGPTIAELELRPAR